MRTKIIPLLFKLAEEQPKSKIKPIPKHFNVDILQTAKVKPEKFHRPISKIVLLNE